LETARLATPDENIHRKVLNKAMVVLSEASLTSPPPETARLVYRVIKEETACDDPYRELKLKYNRIAKGMYPRLKKLVASSKDSLLAAVRIAIAGNIIDFGVGSDFDLEGTLSEAMVSEFAIDDYPRFKESLAGAKRILYLGDNAGEIVFDKVLIEVLVKNGRHITYGVKGQPVINDCTLADARFVEMDKFAQVISDGSDVPGTILKLCSPEFVAFYRGADMVICKGQGNYETLSLEKDRSVFFLLKVKCPVIARDLGVGIGSIVLKKG
jgi:hypothetical protein